MSREPAEAVRIRPRDKADLEACVRMLAEVHEHDGYPVNWPADPLAWLTDPCPLAAWVVELDGRLVGHVALAPRTTGDIAPALFASRTGRDIDDTGVVGRLFVSPAARGHGIGARLLTQAVGHALDHRLRPVLDVVASDVSAIVLYERLGWTLLSSVDQQWGPDRTVTVHSYAGPDRVGKVW